MSSSSSRALVSLESLFGSPFLIWPTSDISFSGENMDLKDLCRCEDFLFNISLSEFNHDSKPHIYWYVRICVSVDAWIIKPWCHRSAHLLQSPKHYFHFWMWIIWSWKRKAVSKMHRKTILFVLYWFEACPSFDMIFINRIMASYIHQSNCHKPCGFWNFEGKKNGDDKSECILDFLVQQTPPVTRRKRIIIIMG